MKREEKELQKSYFCQGDNLLQMPFFLSLVFKAKEGGGGGAAHQYWIFLQ